MADTPTEANSLDLATGPAAPPRYEVSGDLDHYLKMADETTRQLLAGDDPLLQALRRYVDCLHRDVWDLSSGPQEELSRYLSIHAAMLFQGAIRVALSGHAAAVYPVLRTALEAAGYALLISSNPTLADVWLHRHRSAADRKACRNAFDFKRVVGQVKCILPALVDLVSRAYDSLIDYGAHPNVTSVMGHVAIDDQRDDGLVAIGLTALHGPTNVEMVRGLCACLDIGLCIIGLALMAHTRPSQQWADLLQRLSDLKNAAIAPYETAPAEDTVDG